MDNYWVNVDLPTKRFVLHNPDCAYVDKKVETDYKGLLQIKRDGGWLSFETSAAAEQYRRENHPQTNFRRCEVCNP